MKLILCTLAFTLIHAHAMADSMRDFLDGAGFEQICAKSVVEKEPSEALGKVWEHVYLLKDASFTEDDKYTYVGLTRSKNKQSYYTIFRSDKSQPDKIEEFFEVTPSAFDLTYYKGSLWILHGRALTELNLTTMTTRDLVLSKHEDFHKSDHAYDLAVVKDRIYVSHGTMGLIVVNPEKFSIEATLDLGLKQSNGHESLASSMAVTPENTILIAVDNLTLPIPNSRPFNGIVEVRLGSGNTYSHRHYPYMSGVITRFSKMTFADGTLWINNWGTLHYVNLQSLRSKGAAYPGWIPTKYTEDQIRYSAELLGEPFVFGKSFYSCAKRNRLGEGRHPEKVGIAYRIPDLSSLGILDSLPQR